MRGKVRGTECVWLRSAELPSVSALVTKNKCCHRFISRSGLDLVIGTVILLTLPTLQHISRCTLNRI